MQWLECKREEASLILFFFLQVVGCSLQFLMWTEFIVKLIVYKEKN